MQAQKYAPGHVYFNETYVPTEELYVMLQVVMIRCSCACLSECGRKPIVKLLLEDTRGWTTFCLAFGASGRHHILSSVVPSWLHNFWVFEEEWFYVDKSVCINLHTVWFPFSECNGLRERLHRFRPSGVWHISYGDGHWGRGGLHPVPICDGDVEVMSRWSLPIRLNNQRQKM